MKLNNSAGLIILAIVLTFFGCSDNNEGTATGKLTVRMTDAPFPTDLVAEANVTINKIEIRKSGENNGSPFITLSQEETSLNLLELTNGVTATLVDLDVPVGKYDLVRIYVKEAGIVLKDDSFFDLTVPSGAQTGIKVFVDPEIEVAGGLTTELLLDFDVSRSFIALGNMDTPAGINGFIFTPVIKAANLSTSGRLTGEIKDNLSNTLEGAMISVYAADTLNTTTFSDADGSYTVLGLLAGSYDITVESAGYVSQTSEDVEIVSANETKQDFELVVE